MAQDTVSYNWRLIHDDRSHVISFLAKYIHHTPTCKMAGLMLRIYCSVCIWKTKECKIIKEKALLVKNVSSGCHLSVNREHLLPIRRNVQDKIKCFTGMLKIRETKYSQVISLQWQNVLCKLAQSYYTHKMWLRPKTTNCQQCNNLNTILCQW